MSCKTNISKKKTSAKLEKMSKSLRHNLIRRQKAKKKIPALPLTEDVNINNDKGF